MAVEILVPFTLRTLTIRPLASTINLMHSTVFRGGVCALCHHARAIALPVCFLSNVTIVRTEYIHTRTLALRLQFLRHPTIVLLSSQKLSVRPQPTPDPPMTDPKYESPFDVRDDIVI